MGYLFTIIAVLCGIVLLIEMDTGSLSQLQVAGIGLIFAALAAVSPSNWAWPRV